MNQDSIIYFENVSKWFGDFQVLNGINLEVNKGEKIVWEEHESKSEEKVEQCSSVVVYVHRRVVNAS